MATVEYKHASRIFDPGKPPAVSQLDLSIRDGELLVLVGPSGSGKSTAMRMLAGLEPVDEGAVFIDGRDVTGARARDRDVAMVFQSYALYPNMTARQNMSFALENEKLDRAEIERRVERAAAMLELGPLMDKRPAAMSGGQRQRVAMGRSIVRNPKVWCMDEPLSNLDATLRVSTRAQIADLQRELGVTTIYVTHDQVEAMTMGDRVAVLRDGQLQQVADPIHLYEHPANVFVARFIGSPAMTIMHDVPVRDGHAVLDAASGLRVPVPAEFSAHVRDTVTVGVRPESWEITGEGDAPGTPALPLRVHLVEKLGSEAFIHCVLPDTPGSGSEDARAMRLEKGRATVRVDKFLQMEAGSTIHVRPNARETCFFDPASGENLEVVVGR